MNKTLLRQLLLTAFSIAMFFTVKAQPAQVTKTNPMKVYVHYMPWFTAPENPGSGVTSFGNGNTGDFNKWGPHWSHVNSNVANPDNFTTVTDYTGAQVQTRNICSHFHPLIGPYDGQDPNVVEYHLLLMKLSGIDGVMIDWYGQAGDGAADAGPLLTNSNALINKTASVGEKFGLVMEDAAWTGMGGAQANGSYAVNNYFNNGQYIKVGDMRNAPGTGAPLVCVFGPQQFKSPGQWNTILSGNTGGFLPLYGQSAQIGADAGGEFVWPYPQAGQGGNPPAWYANNASYYTNTAGSKNVVLGAAYPGFNDFYGGGGADADGIIPYTYNGTSTITAMLSLCNANKSVIDGIQIATWNDFSEGTIIEPTVEQGYANLTAVQAFTGVSYTQADLQQVYRLFTLRKKYAGNTTKQSQLDQAFNYFVALNIPQAKAEMDIADGITNPAPAINSATTASGAVGSAFSYTITATNTPTGYNATGLPGGLSVNTTTGVISGTPTSAGSTTVALSATNSGGTGTQNLVINITAPAKPGITSSASASVTVNSSFSYTITANGGPTSYNATGLPAGLSVNTSTGVISGTPTATGNSTVTISATNAVGTGTQSLVITVNAQPLCSTSMIINTSTAPTIDGTIDAIWSNAPKNTLTKTISGTIQTGSTWQALYDATNLYVLVQVKDANLSSVGTNVYDQDGVELFLSGNNSKAGAYTSMDHQYRFDWNVAATTANITGNTGSTTGITYAIPTATGGYTLEVKIPWSTIGGTAPVNGKPIGFDININDQQNNAAAREATVGWNGVASDDYMNTADFGTVNLTICTAATPSAPVINSATTATGTAGTAFSYTITASNSPTSYTATGLPAGLSINTSTGVISGTPTTAATSTVSVSATNAGGTGNATVSINISPGAVTAPVISSAGTATGATSAAFSYTITASNTPTSYNATGLPAGLSVNTTSGVISGTPTTAATSAVTISATNSGGTGTKALSITVSNSVVAPAISSASAATGTVGTAFSYTITGSNTPTSYNATGLPAGLSVNTTTGVISGTPTTAATSSVTISAINSGGTGTKTLSITVSAATSAESPYGGTAATIPGTIQAENYDLGGQGVAYNDAEILNQGGQYRTSDGVDIEATTDAGGGYDVGWTNAGEWMKYTVNVSTTGVYTLQVRLASPNTGETLHVESDGVNISGTVTVPNTGGWQTWQTATVTTSSLTAGQHILRIYEETAGFNINYITFVSTAPVSAPVVLSTATASGITGSAFSYTITASNTPTSYSATGLPAGLSVNTSTGLISGTPTVAATSTVTVTAINSGGTGSKVVTITIAQGADPAGIVTCLKAPGTITIDGNLSETGWNLNKSVTKTTIGTPNNTTTFGVLWDNTNLYIGAKVLDANLFSTNATAANYWNNDAVEIFIDANNNKSTSYDGSDNQIIESYNQSGVFTKLAISGLQHAWAPVAGGYTVELAIPWSQLGITAPAAGTTIGFDLGNDDDDNGSGRANQAVWNGTVNDYQNTAAFGSLVLSAATSTTTNSRPDYVEDDPAAIETKTADVLLMPNPVPAQQGLTIVTPGWQGQVDLQVVNFEGVVLERGVATIAGDRITLSTANLRAGAYIIQLRNGNNNVTKKFIVQ